MVIRVNGRVRDTVEVPVTITPEEMQAIALDREKVVALLDGKGAHEDHQRCRSPGDLVVV